MKQTFVYETEDPNEFLEVVVNHQTDEVTMTVVNISNEDKEKFFKGGE